MARRALVICSLVPATIGSVACSSDSDHARTRSAAPERTVFRLPRYTGPGRLAIAGDGSVWMTRDYGGLARLNPTGETEEFLTDDSDEEYVSDLVTGPDGAIWAAAEPRVVRIDTDGEATERQVGLAAWPEAIATANGAVWVLDSGTIGDGIMPALVRLRADGTRREFEVPVPRRWLGFDSLTGAPDGSLWFTQSGDHRGGIGRMTADGLFSQWWLPRSAGQPGRIVADADGAIWFSEPHAIASITTTGDITHFPLRDDLGPQDLVAGIDGGLWFVSDVCVGRMATSGEVATWPVPGALQLDGIAAAPDGTLWLADKIGNTIRRFRPQTTPAAPCGAPTFTRRTRSTTATVSYHRLERYDGIDLFTDIRMRIARGEAERFSEAVPGLRDYDAFGYTSSLSVRDLDGDREPEVVLELTWYGTHCCYWWRVYRYDAERRTYVPSNHFWGNAGAEPKLRDLDGNGRPELVSIDDRFDEAFAPFAGSFKPIQIWSYHHGAFRDVTRRHPRLIRRDARGIWRFYRRRPSYARSLLPAWAADQYMLGRGAVADRALERARQRGDLARTPGFYGPRDPAAYIRALKALLRKTGYAP